MLEKRTVSQCTSSDYCKGWNDAVDEMPKWIDVNERLPEKDDDYLVFSKSGCFYVFSYVDGWNCSRNSDGSIYRDAEINDGTITHWMPLPEPPKEGVNNG